MEQRLRFAAFVVFGVAFFVRLLTGAHVSRLSFPPSEILCLGLSGAAFALAAATSRLILPRRGLIIAGLLFLAFYAVALVRAENQLEANLRACGILQLLLFFGAALILGSDPSLRRALIWLCVAAAVSAALVSLWQRFITLPSLSEAAEKQKLSPLLSALVEKAKHRIQKLEPFAYFILPNMLCALLVAMLATLSSMVKALKDKEGRIAFFVLCGLVLVAGVLSKARGGWVLLAGAVLLFYLMRRWGVKRALLLACAVASFLLVLSLTPVAEAAPTPAQVRMLYWRGSLQLAARNPLGTGLASFRTNFMRIQSPLCEPVRSPHNAFLLYLTEGGWMLGLAVLLLYIFGYLSLRRETPLSFKPDRRVALLFVLSGILGVVLVYYLPHHISVIRDTGEMALLTMVGVLLGAWFMWRFDVDVPVWAGVVTMFVLAGSTLIDFSHLETNFAVVAAVWAGLWLEGRSAPKRWMRPVAIGVAGLITAVGLLTYPPLLRHFCKVTIGQETAWRGLSLLDGKPELRRRAPKLINSGLKLLKEAISEMPSDTIARKFDIRIRHAIWRKTGKGTKSLKKRAIAMLSFLPDYRLAYTVLTQIAVQEGRVWDAAAFAWKRAELAPADPAVWADAAIVFWTGWQVASAEDPLDPSSPVLLGLACVAAKKALQLDSLKRLKFPHLPAGQRLFLCKIIEPERR